jgi:hypothetical protein
MPLPAHSLWQRTGRRLPARGPCGHYHRKDAMNCPQHTPLAAHLAAAASAGAPLANTNARCHALPPARSLWQRTWRRLPARGPPANTMKTYHALPSPQSPGSAPRSGRLRGAPPANIINRCPALPSAHSPGSAPGGGRQRRVLQAQEGGVQLVVRDAQQPLRQRAPGGRVACDARAASAPPALGQGRTPAQLLDMG